jgi:uncharacterized protein YjiS (DUF1127 family)
MSRAPEASAASVTWDRGARQSGAMSDRYAWLDALWRACAGTLSVWIGRATTRQALHELDDRLLADIGRTEPERRRECAKWFWHG